MMTATMKDVGIDQLNAEQKISLAMEIWESLGDARPAGHLTSNQLDILARRDAELESKPEIALNWQQIRDSVEKQL